MDYVLLAIEEREWNSKRTGNSGKNYCLNNSAQNTIDCFGHKGSLTIINQGEELATSNAPKVFLWLNDMGKDEYEAFVEEYGTEIYIHIPTKTFITVEEFNNLGVEQTSAQPSASF
tara:strand:+ start:262 stop:609 length:348 start_codon:yes stop_codon:yes gene_type:complete